MAWCRRTWVALTALVTLLPLQLPADDARAAEEDFPKPALIDLTTRDGLALKATYCGQSEGAKAVPILLLHDYKGNRNALTGLAQSFQKKGHAVIVPDLRGHGDSTKFQIGQAFRDVSKMQNYDFVNMVEFDLEAVRKFLVRKNDQQEVNLNKLCVIGAGMGATVALNWTARDWSAPPLAIGKQGQDVKVLVLISPAWGFKGVPNQTALRFLGGRDIGDKISVLVLVGRKNPRALHDARRVYKSFERWRPETDRSEESEQTLHFYAFDTSLQGGKLLSANGMNLDEGMSKFILLRAAEVEYPWTARRARGR